MYADGTGQLGQTGYGLLYLAAGRHKQVRELVDDHYDIRHVLVSLVGVELAGEEFLVVLLDIAHGCGLEQVIAVVHQLAQRAESIDHPLGIGDDGLLSVRKLGQIMLLQWRIERKLHLLRVHQHELEFRRMLLIKQGGNDSVQSHRPPTYPDR